MQCFNETQRIPQIQCDQRAFSVDDKTSFTKYTTIIECIFILETTMNCRMKKNPFNYPFQSLSSLKGDLDCLLFMRL